MSLRRIVFFSLIFAGVACAQDPPSRVARLNWLNGSVSFQPAGIDTWTAASPNYPLTTGDHLYTDDRSQAEMHIGRNAIRLDRFSNFGYLNLDDRTVQMRFTEGQMEVRLRELADDDLYEVDTPQGAITLLRGGDYRIDTDPERNATMITVRAGEVEVTANGQAFPVHPRQTAYFTGDNPPDIRNANDPDAFDRFVADRNRMEDTPPPHQYVPAAMIGGDDLYRYGNWRQVPGYGMVWVPPGRADWAPYRDGHWAWVEPWGWTWIDDAPWGFAPFHYGRWAHSEVGWFWVPGPVAVRPVYAPALVAFVGGPSLRIGVAVGGGLGIGVAWFPLGPREVYRPVYHGSPAYVNRVNVTNVTNITNVNVTNVNVTKVTYVNQTVPGAVTAVPQQAFASRQPVRGAMQPVSQQQIAQAQVVGSAPQVAPQRESLLGRGAANVPHPPQAVMARPVVAKQTPPPPAVAFQARQQALAANPGRPLAPQAVQELRAQQPQARVQVAPVRPATQAAPAARQPVPAIRQAPENARPLTATPQQTTPAPAPAQAPRPEDRLSSRPPNARPITPAPAAPAPVTPPVRPETRPETARPETRPETRPESRPEAVRPTPASVPQRPVEASHPAPPARPEAPPARPEARPARQEERPKPQANRQEKREEKKDEKKEDKKQP